MERCVLLQFILSIMLRGSDDSSSEWSVIRTFFTSCVLMMPIALMAIRKHVDKGVYKNSVYKYIGIEMETDIERGYCAVYEYN